MGEGACGGTGVGLVELAGVSMRECVVSGDWGMGRGCGQRTKKVCAAQKRSELRPGGLFVVVSVRVRAEYIYTLSISRPRPHVILLHTPDAETPARRHTPRGRIPHPTCTQSRYHANGKRSATHSHNGVGRDT